MDNSKEVILFFVKYPEAGQVKTRLGKTLGHQQAAKIYRNFITHFLDRADEEQAPLWICYAPEERGDGFKAWLGGERTYLAQKGKDLGERMASAFLEAFWQGKERVLILGSDSPDLPWNTIEEAFLYLQEGKAVLGPTPDGGYYAIGFSRESFFTEVFQNIPWSTSEVLEKTLSVLREHQHPFHLLPHWWDIDTEEDLRAFWKRNPLLEWECLPSAEKDG